MEIKKSYQPKRCEICHQTDRFDAESNTCSRCQGLNLSAPVDTMTLKAIPSWVILFYRLILASLALTSSLISYRFIDSLMHPDPDICSIGIEFLIIPFFIGVIILIIVGIFKARRLATEMGLTNKATVYFGFCIFFLFCLLPILGMAVSTIHERYHAALKAGDVREVRLMLSLGVDVNYSLDYCQYPGNEKCWSPLMMAVASGNREVVQTLIEHKVHITRPAYDRTPLMLAVEQGDLAIAEMLIKAGTDVNQKVYLGYTVLRFAHKLDKDMAKLLIVAGANVNEKSSSGETPLMSAAFAGKLEVIEILLANGADPTSKDIKGKTAADYATKPQIIALLKSLSPSSEKKAAENKISFPGLGNSIEEWNRAVGEGNPSEHERDAINYQNGKYITRHWFHNGSYVTKYIKVTWRDSNKVDKNIAQTEVMNLIPKDSKQINIVRKNNHTTISYYSESLMTKITPLMGGTVCITPWGYSPGRFKVEYYQVGNFIEAIEITLGEPHETDKNDCSS